MPRGRHIETDKQPFSVGNEAGRVAAAVALQLQVDAARVIRPRAELQLVVMVREILERTNRQTDRHTSSRNTPRAELQLVVMVLEIRERTNRQTDRQTDRHTSSSQYATSRTSAGHDGS